jgi:hypothetical protein
MGQVKATNCKQEYVQPCSKGILSYLIEIGTRNGGGTAQVGMKQSGILIIKLPTRPGLEQQIPHFT